MRKTTVYITLAIVLLIVYFWNKRTRMENTTSAPVIQPNPNDIQAAFTRLKNTYGYDFAKKIEQLYRLETAHFESGQFKEGNSPGMVAFKSTYPYGWKSLDEFALAHSIDGHKFGIGRTFVVRGKNYRYVTFPDFKTSLDFVAWFIRNKRGGVVQKWNSLDPAASTKYLNKLNQITTHFV